jgi:uncharacterized protein (DUF1684 family)
MTLTLTITVSAVSVEEHKAEILNWQKARDAKLRLPNSWLTLVGLFWLKDGNNTIGSGDTNDFVLPPGSSPPNMATLQLHDGVVSIEPSTGVPVMVNGTPVTGPAKLNYDGDKPDQVTVGRISFFIIKRGERLAVRAKDSENPVLKNFTGMHYFPINSAYRIEARFTPDEKKIPVPNVLGETEQELSPGYVEFELNGKSFRMRPVFEDDTLFFIFKDETSKTETYQAGRMLNTPLPKDGKVVLDFNRSYNPPCTFTPYATCPLPPKENNLATRIEAGELRYGQGHPE